MLPGWIGSVAGISGQNIPGFTKGAGCLTAELFPSGGGLGLAEAKLPFSPSRRRRYPFASLGHQGRDTLLWLPGRGRFRSAASFGSA
jgi:hypothetical protein